MLNFKDLDTPSLIKWAILAVLAAFSCYVTFPAKEKVRLGLDLQGGTSFTVQIDEAKLTEDLKAQGFAAAGVTPETATPEQIAQIENKAKADAQAAMTDADDLTLEVLRKRIDAIGTNEPIIAKANGHRILIQIPGADAAKAKAAEESVKSAAFLAFRRRFVGVRIRAARRAACLARVNFDDAVQLFNEVFDFVRSLYDGIGIDNIHNTLNEAVCLLNEGVRI